MSIWNENWVRTEKSLKIDNMLREKLQPVFDLCMDNGMSIEDFYYISISLINEMSMIEVLKRR
mgnify:CR=1 FL=1